MTTDDLLKQGIAALKAGHRDVARSLLAQAVEQDKHNETAWLWLSGAMDTDEERYACLEKVLEINPDNEAAKRGMVLLQEGKTRNHLPAIGPREVRVRVETIGTWSTFLTSKPIILQSSEEKPKKDDRGKFVEEGFLSTKRRFCSGELQGISLDKGAYRQVIQKQETAPIKVMSHDDATWWMFRDEFYWEDKGYKAAAVKALVLDSFVDSESVADRRFQQSAAHIERMRSAPATLIERLQESNVFLARVDSLCRRRNDLVKDVNMLTLQMALLATLGVWIDEQINAPQHPTEVAVRDCMNELGFAVEDIQSFRHGSS